MSYTSFYTQHKSLVLNVLNIFILIGITSNLAFAQGTITGNIVYANDSLSPIHDSTLVRLYQGNTLIHEIPLNSNGNFIFDSVMPGTYRVNAYVSKTPGGWNAMDSYRVQRHFVGIQPPLSGIYLVAADANNSGGVPGAIDELIICRRFTFHITTLNNPNGPHPTYDWVSQNVSVTVTPGNTQTITVKVLCTGDVDGSFIPY